MNEPLSPAAFQKLGHQVIDQLSAFLESLEKGRPLTAAERPEDVRKALGGGDLPLDGRPPEVWLEKVLERLLDHSLYNGHPGFMGYITSSALPIGALGDLIAAAINQNVGAFRLSPMATEMERQTIRWIAEFIGFPKHSGGILVSGGNMANFVGFLTARRVKGEADIQRKGLKNLSRQMVVYASSSTHTWIQKAADLFGLGTDAIRWIPTDEKEGMDVNLLEEAVVRDKKDGLHPFLAVGTAGSVSFGIVDPLPEIAAICRSHDLWFHVDGAYGAPAAGLDGATPSLRALNLADSVAIDPHKWLYSPLEVGCALIRDPGHLQQTFSYHPDYYEFGTENSELDYHEYGPQNSRGFRALKVWLSFQLLGKKGLVRLIEKDINLSRILFQKIGDRQELVRYSNHLSIATFSYVPSRIQGKESQHLPYLNELNQAIVQQVYLSGKAFLSNAYAGDRYLLRACLVNFRTREEDLDTLLDLIVTFGRQFEKIRKP